ncbi:hypothetical protein EMGBD4_14970 [Verrucomicrobiota bacterium]|nr:hypothetical protein EMGBD4_14970 [Verrucomicrobiota bacterium]
MFIWLVNGLNGSGCWLRVEGLWLKGLSEVMRRAVGMPLPLTHRDFDEKYVEALTALIRGSYVDKALLLAQDEVYDDAGTKLAFGSFHVPNDYLFKVCAAHPEFVPAVSIHPGRKDALAELERCLAGGARALKLLAQLPERQLRPAAVR